MARPASNLRLFAAAYPPLELARRWLDQAAALDLPAHRPIPPEQVHLTLLFIGDTPVRQMDNTIESTERSCVGIDAFDLHTRAVIALPNEKPNLPARLVAMECDAPPSLLELQRRLATRLAGKPRRKPGRAFRPHFTLCRFNAPCVVSLNVPVDTSQDIIPVREIRLMRSTLTPEGAHHHTVQAFQLER